MKKGLSASKRYAVAKGRKVGVFNTWSECERSIKGYRGAVFKSFRSAADATRWLEEATVANVKSAKDAVVVYTDGACENNQSKHARAGVGVWFGNGDARNVSEPLAGKRQTNQRAELTAVIRALQIVYDQPLHVWSDSEYCVLGVQHRLHGWAAKQFVRVANDDLWKETHALIVKRQHPFTIAHIEGHSGVRGNEAADRLAVRGICRD